MTPIDRAESVRTSRYLRALHVMDAFHRTREKDVSATLADVLTTISAACGMETYEHVRAQLDTGTMATPGTLEWPLYFTSAVHQIRALTKPPVPCATCNGAIEDGQPTVRSRISGSSGGGHFGKVRHEACPDLEDLLRCPSCRGILYPLPRETLHSQACELNPIKVVHTA